MAEFPGAAGSVVVGVADIAIATKGELRQLVTYALGSCLGVTAYDPQLAIGGMVHFMLPQPPARLDPRVLDPCMCATSAVELLFARLLEGGADKRRLVVCAAGAAQILRAGGADAVGRRNDAMLRRLLDRDGMALAADDTGGNLARTMSLDLADGTVCTTSQAGTEVLWAPRRCVPGRQLAH